MNLRWKAALDHEQFVRGQTLDLHVDLLAYTQKWSDARLEAVDSNERETATRFRELFSSTKAELASLDARVSALSPEPVVIAWENFNEAMGDLLYWTYEKTKQGRDLSAVSLVPQALSPIPTDDGGKQMDAVGASAMRLRLRIREVIHPVSWRVRKWRQVWSRRIDAWFWLLGLPARFKVKFRQLRGHLSRSTGS